MTLTPATSPHSSHSSTTMRRILPGVSFNASGSVSGSFKIGSPIAKAAHGTYVSNGFTMNSSGYLANPTHSAQVAANNAGALTRNEASRMGLPLGGRR